MQRQGVLFCFIGPSGSGKSTHVKRLLDVEAGNIKVSISATTREPRSYEKEGVHYYFMTRREFEAKIEDGNFFEWEEIHGNYYGTLRSNTKQLLESGVDLILDIDIRGAVNFKRQFPNNTVICFLAPPSFGELVRRIRLRSVISEVEVQRRIATAKFEYEQLLEYVRAGEVVDYFVVNDSVDEAHAVVMAIVAAERAKLWRLNKRDVALLCSVNEE